MRVIASPKYTNLLLASKSRLTMVIMTAFIGGVFTLSQVFAVSPSGLAQYATSTPLSQIFSDYPSQQAIVMAPQISDVNNDSKADAITLESANNNISNLIVTRLGNGDGTFGPTLTTSASWARQLKIADFNGDGIKDAVDVGYAGNPAYGNDGTFEVRLGNGDGTFATTPQQSIETSGDSNGCYVTDINNDGHLDVLVSFPHPIGVNTGSNSQATAYINDGAGHFTTSSETPFGIDGAVVAVADFNSDGKPDLLFGDAGYGGSIWEGDGTGGFFRGSNQRINGVGSFVYNWSRPTVADFTNDGKPDIALMVHSTNTGADINALRVLPNLGDGIFGNEIFSSRLSSTGYMESYDMNGDGNIDIADWDNSGISLYLGDGTGRMSGAQTLATPPMYEMGVGDMNNDGNPDILLGAAATSNAANRPSLSLNTNPNKNDTTAPVIGALNWTANPKAITATSILTTPVADGASGVNRGEYFVDTDPGQGNGTNMVLNINDGTLSTTIGTGLLPGVYKVGVRAQDNAGNWSAPIFDYLVVFNPAGLSVTGKNKKDLVPSLTGGDILPGLVSSNQADAADYGFTVAYKNGNLNPGSDFQFTYATGTNCKKASANNCHNFNMNATNISWLVIDQTNNSRSRFQGIATLIVDGLTTTNPFTIEAIDGDLINSTTPDSVVLKVYPTGSDPTTATASYKASGYVNKGNGVRIR